MTQYMNGVRRKRRRRRKRKKKKKETEEEKEMGGKRTINIAGKRTLAVNPVSDFLLP